MLSLKHTIEYMSRLPKRFYWAQMAHMQLKTVDISLYSSKEPTLSTLNILSIPDIIRNYTEKRYISVIQSYG